MLPIARRRDRGKGRGRDECGVTPAHTADLYTITAYWQQYAFMSLPSYRAMGRGRVGVWGRGGVKSGVTPGHTAVLTCMS